MPYRGEIGKLVEITRTGEEELSVEWQIRDVLSLPSGRDDRYASREFRIGAVHWWFGLRPNWTDKRSHLVSGFMRLVLEKLDTGPPQNFHFSVGIRGSRGVEKIREGEKEFSRYGSCYWNDFCSRSEMVEHRTRLMPDGVLNITCVLKNLGSVRGNGESSRKRKFVESGEANVLSRTVQGMEELKGSLKRLLLSGKDSDVIIKVQGKEFPAHRLILQARSPVFEAMFSHDMVEKLRGVVTMEDCDQEMLPAFLEHVYTGSIEMISTGNVFSLFIASDKYDLKTLKKACEEFVKKNLTITSFCDTITLAIKYDEEELTELATEFFCSHSLEICRTVEWQIFLKENTTVGNELIMKAFSK